jgi:hypothetical protein
VFLLPELDFRDQCKPGVMMRVIAIPDWYPGYSSQLCGSQNLARTLSL